MDWFWVEVKYFRKLTYFFQKIGKEFQEYQNLAKQVQRLILNQYSTRTYYRRK